MVTNSQENFLHTKVLKGWGWWDAEQMERIESLLSRLVSLWGKVKRKERWKEMIIRWESLGNKKAGLNDETRKKVFLIHEDGKCG